MSSANNTPTYYNFELWYMDMTTWETSERRFPAGAVLVSDTALSSTELTEHTTSQAKMVRLGDHGTTGGTDTHTHDFGYTVDSASTGDFATNNSSQHDISINYGLIRSYYVSAAYDHAHGTGTITSATATSFPGRVRTRLYKANSTTSKAESGVICFTDSTPSGYWTPMTSWSTYFLASYQTDAYILGSATHTHTVSGTSPSHNYGYNNVTVWGDPAPYENFVYETMATHSHTISPTVDNGDDTPQYVYLVPIKLNTTLLHVNTYTSTAALDALILKHQTSAYSMAMKDKKVLNRSAGFKTQLSKYDIDKTYTHDAKITLRGEPTYDMEGTLLRTYTSGIGASLDLAILTDYINMSMRLIRLWEPQGAPVLDSIMKAWVDQIDGIDQETQIMYLNNNLDFAAGSDLDDKWGDIYELPRLASETDDHYRKRIKAYVTMQTGSGTKATLESVIDTIIHIYGDSEVTTRRPGYIDVHFTTGEALHAAYSNLSLLNYVLPSAVAAGISYTLYITYTDYTMDLMSKGTNVFPWTMQSYVKKPDVEAFHYMVAMLADQKDKTYTADTLVMDTFEKLTYIITTLVNIFSKAYSMVSTFKKARTKSYTHTAILKQLDFEKDYDMNSRIISTIYVQSYLDMLAKKTRTCDACFMTVRLV